MDSSDNTVLIRDGELSAYDYGSGTFTIDLTNATYVEATVDAATATDLRMIEGGRTNVPELPDYCEKYLINSAILDIFGRDGSRLSKAAEKKLERVEASLLKNFIQATRDWPAVPELDH
jgi:hypothetical protein